MKLLGHAYVSLKSFPDLNKELVAYGSLLPETVFYTKDPELTFEQIHEGGLTLYQYCTAHYLKYTDLAVGCMTHSVKYGADSYNSLDHMARLGFTEQDIPKISTALNIPHNIAIARVHNLYDLVIDYHIHQSYPEIKNVVLNCKAIDTKEVSKVLSEAFNANEDRIHNNLSHLWDKYDLELFSTFRGLARFWKILASDLKEKDPVDIDQTSTLLNEFYIKMLPTVDDFIKEVVNSTKTKVTSAISSIN